MGFDSIECCCLSPPLMKFLKRWNQHLSFPWPARKPVQTPIIGRTKNADRDELARTTMVAFPVPTIPSYSWYVFLVRLLPFQYVVDCNLFAIPKLQKTRYIQSCCALYLHLHRMKLSGTKSCTEDFVVLVSLLYARPVSAGGEWIPLVQ